MRAWCLLAGLAIVGCAEPERTEPLNLAEVNRKAYDYGQAAAVRAAESLVRNVRHDPMSLLRQDLIDSQAATVCASRLTRFGTEKLRLRNPQTEMTEEFRVAYSAACARGFAKGFETYVRKQAAGL